jgi:potassium channel subfamily K, other eukaryote
MKKSVKKKVNVDLKRYTPNVLPDKHDLHALPVFAPLIAAVLAPLSTLLDIPAFSEVSFIIRVKLKTCILWMLMLSSQRWFFTTDPTTGNSKPLPDPTTNLALSAVGLAFNVLANALLLVRFSVSERWWRYATKFSLACWVLKVRTFSSRD